MALQLRLNYAADDIALQAAQLLEPDARCLAEERDPRGMASERTCGGGHGEALHRAEARRRGA